MIAVSEAVFYWLIDFYILATVIFVAAYAAMNRLAQPARRLTVGWSATCGLAALATVTALPVWPRAGWPALPAPAASMRPAEQASAAPSGRRAGEILAISSEPVVDNPARAPALAAAAPGERGSTPQAVEGRGALATSGHPLSGWRALGRGAFAAGAAVMLAWLVVGHWHTSALRRGSVPAPGRVRECLARLAGEGRSLPELLISDRLGQPVALGLFKPCIILPGQLTADDPERGLDAALAHEWAHIRNRDLWLIALSRLLLPISFAHPAYWWLRGRIRDDQEALADASASRSAPIDYAGVLLSWARSARDRPRLAVAGSVALWERPSQLKKRIAVLLDRNFRVETTSPPWWRVAVATGMALAVFALSVVSFRPVAARPLAYGSQDGGTPAAPAQATKQTAGAIVRIVDSRGNPAAGARVYRTDTRFAPDGHAGTATLLGRAGDDGSFRLSDQDFEAAKKRTSQTVAVVDRAGPAFVDPSVGNGMKEIRLAEDDVPIRGRVLDISGQPVAGARVGLVAILWSASGKLDEWLAALNAEKVAYPVQGRLLRSWTSHDIPSLYQPVVTGPDGRFTLEGVGRERLASILISGPKIETRCEFVATRAMPAVTVPDFDRQNQARTITYHGAEFDLVAGPCLEVLGTITDKDTSKPIAGAVVQTATFFGNPMRCLSTTTDGAGRYKLTGIPPKNTFGQADDILASVPLGAGPAYLPSVQPLNRKPSDGPITIDFALKRGVVASGRVTDGVTGKPIQANLDYFILEDNAHVSEYPRYGTVRAGMPYRCDEDGNFKLVVMPGRGILGARHGNENYRLGVGIEKIKGLKETFPGAYRTAGGQHMSPQNYNMVVEIDPRPETEAMTVEIKFDRGKTVKGSLVGPDGEPVSGALMMGAEDFFQSWTREPLASSEFEVHSLGSRSRRGLLFVHEEKKLAGAYVVKPGENGPITVKLEPCGTVTGRLTENGVPWAQGQLTSDRPYEDTDLRYLYGSLPGAMKTGSDGRFQVSGLVPGLKYSFRVWKGNRIVGEAVKDLVLSPGETKDVGDVKAQD